MVLPAIALPESESLRSNQSVLLTSRARFSHPRHNGLLPLVLHLKQFIGRIAIISGLKHAWVDLNMVQHVLVPHSHSTEGLDKGFRGR